MAKVNVKTNAPYLNTTTYEGAPARIPVPLKELRRAVASCLLWEDTFYESGVEIATRIKDLASKVDPRDLANLAVEARNNFKLRHVPLWLAVHLAKTGSGIPHLVQDTLVNIVQRADEPGELLSLYWKANPNRTNGKKAPLPNQFKKGLARAVKKFDAYQLAKYNRDVDVALRDVIFLTHANPEGLAQSQNFARLVNKDFFPEGLKDKLQLGDFKKIDAPDTWEVALSSGADKKETFERMLSDGKLGYLALLRNLRNMVQANVNPDLVRDAIVARKGAHNVLPFRFIAAARYAPDYEAYLDQALIAQIDGLPQFDGETTILVDISGSMDSKLSAKSDLDRADAAATLAAVFPSKKIKVYSFSDRTVKVPARKGMAGVEAILKSQYHSGTDLGSAVSLANREGYDRLVVLTDEQSASRVPAPLPGTKSYMINLAGYRPSVAYGSWIALEGFSENIFRYMSEIEKVLE